MIFKQRDLCDLSAVSRHAGDESGSTAALRLENNEALHSGPF